MKEFNTAKHIYTDDPYCGRTNLVPDLSKITRYLNKWRLVFFIFLIVFTVLLLLYLSIPPIRWDETPHAYGGLLLKNGQFDKYLTESGFYPPLFDVVTALYFKAFKVSIFSARLVSLTFGILSVWTVFEYANKFYGPRNALIATVLFASMPGFVISSQMALIETMLLFFFSISLLLFFSWMRTNDEKLLILSGITFGLGFLVKYQIVVGGVVMLATLILFGKQSRRNKLTKFLLLILVSGAVIAPWIVVTYQKYASGMLGNWLYVIAVGNEGRLAYSNRFPIPIFYLIEMTQPYQHIHPIALPVYLFALSGLGLWLWRRREEDKFSLITFFVVYIVFTLITSKDWRYITVVFPVLAVAGSDLILFLWDKAKERITTPNISFRTKNLTKVAATGLVLLVSFSVIYSSHEVYSWAKLDDIYIPTEEATRYVTEHTTLDENIVVLCAGNFFSADMVEFYLLVDDPNREQPLQYPELPVDAYKPDFNVNWLIETSETLNVKYLLLFETGNGTFYQSELTAQHVLDMMLETNNFFEEYQLGSFPRRIFILRFFHVSEHNEGN